MWDIDLIQQMSTGWEGTGFVESGNWGSATEIADHGDWPWQDIPNISADAAWIWTREGSSWENDLHVYCRITFGW